MTIPPLPTEYARRIADQLDDAAQAYFDALAQPPVRGLRRNPFKTPESPLDALVEGLQAPVPWAAGGHYLSPTSGAGLNPLHEAGAYYLQEPSAMLPATLLAPMPGETVLDLCAAPGGKSTQLAAAMAGTGTLVCNEPVPGRAQILSRNLERMGVTNAAVVCAAPESLAARWPGLFDAILVDAPCSGEGMFRRHPEARLEWDAQTPVRCALRQRHILESALAMLKVGGRLCYSTCTFSREENEGMIQALLAAHPELTPLPFAVPLGGGRELPAPEGYVRLYPHTVAGEGHFAALLMKTRATEGESRPAQLLPPAQALLPVQAAVSAAYDAFRQACADAAYTITGKPTGNAPYTGVSGNAPSRTAIGADTAEGAAVGKASGILGGMPSAIIQGTTDGGTSRALAGGAGNPASSIISAADAPDVAAAGMAADAVATAITVSEAHAVATEAHAVAAADAATEAHAAATEAHVAATEAHAATPPAASASLPVANAMLGDTLLCAPPLPPLQGVRVLRAGLALGLAKGKVFTPDHALAMAAPRYAFPTAAVACADARLYQRGEALPAPDSLRGYVAVTYCGLPLGFAKASDGWLKNHYPKGLRRP